jgi:hypothetical protein
MIGALKQVEAGRKVEDVAREVGVSKYHKRVHRVYREAVLMMRRKRSGNTACVLAAIASLDSSEPGVWDRTPKKFAWQAASF